MRLLMYLGERLIDSADVPVASLPKLQGQIIKETKQRLLQKHKDDLLSSDQQPTFYLENVPSSINGFRSLLTTTFKEPL